MPDLFVQFETCEVIPKGDFEFESAVSQHCTLKMITVTLCFHHLFDLLQKYTKFH